MSFHRYFILNKPTPMLSQFTGGEPGMPQLGDLPFDFPPGTHAIGRLDNESEGMLLLTTDRRVTSLLFQSAHPHTRTYLVQVYKHVTPETLEKLRSGVEISMKGNTVYQTAPCAVQVVEKPENLFKSGLEYPDFVPQTWLLMTLTEGKFRQIRKMIKAVHHHCQRLIRISIENLTLEELQPGQIRELDEQTFFEKLGINPDSYHQS